MSLRTNYTQPEIRNEHLHATKLADKSVSSFEVNDA